MDLERAGLRYRPTTETVGRLKAKGLGKGLPASPKIMPKMIDVVGLTYRRIMKHPLKINEYLQFVSPDEVTGSDAEDLQGMLRHNFANRVPVEHVQSFRVFVTLATLTFLSPRDQQRYIDRVNQSSGRKFRFMTMAEFDSMPRGVKSQICYKKGDQRRDKNYITVETERGSGEFRRRSLINERINFRTSPIERSMRSICLLVED